MNIFLSWSGVYSEQISKALKQQLEYVFKNEFFKVFLSEEDIHAGTKWYEIIESSLKETDCIILCLTKENIKAPWIYFEAGGVAIKSEKSNVIPLLFDIDLDQKVPLTHFNCVKFNHDQYYKMLKNIKDKGNFELLSNDQFDTIVKKSFTQLSSKISKTIIKLNTHDFEHNIKIYPPNIKMVNKGSLFFGSPMASLKDEDYIKFRNEMLKVKDSLSSIKEIKSIYYPGEQNENPKIYDGNIKAIDDNFKILKECEYMFFVYPKKLPTSMLLEIGYGIALSKRIIIYTPNRDILPFILKEADGIIKNITIHTYSDYKDLIESIKSNGMAIFK